MRIVFLGTPEFAVSALEKLVESRHQVVAVVTQPDKPSGRGNKILPCAVKVFAQQKNIPVYQFAKIGRDGIQTLKELNPDLMITVAYGQILTQQVIDIPKFGIINVHASLLPKYRGASPIQTAIIKGETVTGITIMQTDIGLDTGDILLAESVNIADQDTAETLGRKLSFVGAELLLKALDQIENGTVVKTVQDHSLATFTKKINKEDCIINWDKSADQIKCLIMGANSEPIAQTLLNGNVVKIYTAQVAKDTQIEGQFNNGEILPNSSAKNGVFVKCGAGILKLGKVQLPGGKVLDAEQLYNGRKLKVGDIFEYSVQINN